MLSETGTRFFGYYPGTVAVVTAEHAGVRNVMAAGWHTALSAEPPLYGVAVGRERATHPLIAASGRFGVNFLPLHEARRIQGAGMFSLNDGVNKFERLELETLPGAPLALACAYLHYTCELAQTLPTGDHDLFVGHVREVRHDPTGYDERGLFRGQAAVYLGRSAYVASGQERLEVPLEGWWD